MITIINEKHDQALNFAAALGGLTGTLPANSNLSGEYTIDEAAGHIISFKNFSEMVPEDVKENYMTWDLNKLPFDRTQIKWQLEPNPNCGGRGADAYLRNFKRDLARSDAVIIATDLDPSGEGDLIGFEIILYCNFMGDVYRCEHEDETKDKIRQAFTKLKLVRKKGGPITDSGFYKALARTKFDDLTKQYTRIITDISRRDNVLKKNYVPRTGRLKAAMLQLIGQQEKLHDYFKPHSEFQPALYDQDNHRFTKTVKDPADAKFYDTENEASQHLNEVPQNAVSIETNVKNLEQQPPKMLNLSQVASRLAAKGYSPKKVNELAESLYKVGVLSYPRTEDTKITDSQLAELIPLVPKICDLLDIDQSLIDINNYRKYLIGSTGLQHGANRPGTNVPESMDQLKLDYGDTAAALYEELARSFLAGFGTNKHLQKHFYADDQTKTYTATATIVTDPGYTLILHEQKEDTGREKENDHLFHVGQKLEPAVWEKKAVRPRLATQQMLNTYLRKHGIGTGATQLSTYVDIIDESHKSRQLVTCQKNKLRLAPLGQISYLLMYSTALASPKITKHVEEYLNQIATGKIKENQLLQFFDKMIIRDKKIIMSNNKNLASLPKVKQNIHQDIKGVFQPTGKEVTIKDGFGNYTFTKDNLAALFAGKTIEIPYGKAKVVGKLADREKYGFGFKGEFKYPKPEQATGFSKAAQTDVSFNKTFAGHDFTQSEINDLLDDKQVSFKAKSKKGKSYVAKVKLEYSELYKSKTHEKVWHVAFIPTKKK